MHDRCVILFYMTFAIISPVIWIKGLFNPLPRPSFLKIFLELAQLDDFPDANKTTERSNIDHKMIF